MISKCGDELIDIGEHLKSQATKIKAAQNEFIAKQQQQASAKKKLRKLQNSKKEDHWTLRQL